MINQIPKRVVLRKPKIKRPINSKISKPIHITDQPQPEIQPVAKPVEPEILPDELEIEIPEEPVHTIVKQKEDIKSSEIIFIDEQTFDEKFLDNLDTKSRITKDVVTLEKLQKQELKPTRTTKKRRRRLNIYIIISMIASGGLFLWMYKIVTEYLNGQLDGSLASFMYVVAMGLLTIITFVWFCMEVFKEDTL